MLLDVYFPIGLILSYLLGAIPFGLLIARFKGVDILSQGSGNIGATNVGRILGTKFGLLVFFLDLLKGAIPTKLAMLYLETPLGPELTGILFGASSMLGHLFPIYLKFKGGKGVATGAGVMATLAPFPLALAVLTWVAFVAGWRFVSLASVVCTVPLFTSQIFISIHSPTSGNFYLLAFTCIATLLIWIKHISNIKRLYHGNENSVNDSLLWRSVENILLSLSLGLWLGSFIFFTGVIGPGVFNWFEKLCLTENPPYWLPSPEVLTKDFPPGIPSPFLKEQASRLAGVVVSPLFPIYYLIEVVCGAIATIIFWGNLRRHPSGRLALAMTCSTGFAFLLAIAGWLWLPKVENDRIKRAELTDQIFLQKNITKLDPTVIPNALQARKDFTRSHLISLGMNMLCGLGMLLGIIFFAIVTAKRSLEPVQVPPET